MKLKKSERSNIVDQIRMSGFRPEQAAKPKIENFPTGSFLEKEEEFKNIKSTLRNFFIPEQIGKIFSSYSAGDTIAFYIGEELLYGTILELAKAMNADSRIKMKPNKISVLTDRGVMDISPLQIRTLED